MRRSIRFLVGAGLGSGALAAYLAVVGVDQVVGRAATVAPWALALVVGLVVAEGLSDAIGVWASIEPLGDGLTPGQSVQFALAGDFFDTVSPAGPVSSEPIMAQFIGATTKTSYSEGLAVRSVAKYVKSGGQLVFSGLLVAGFFLAGTAPRAVLVTFGGGLGALVLVGGALVVARPAVSTALVTVLAPVVARVSALYREEPHDRTVVTAAVDRFWARIGAFRGSPGLVGLVLLGGIVEQCLTAAALWVALGGTGTTVAFLPILAIVPLPQVASVVPIPGSLGAYDVLLGGALALMTGASPAATAAAVLVVRTVSLPFAVGVGGFAVAFLRGWRP